MSLASGRDHLAIPGPSVMPERVLRAMHRAAPNIYGGELVDMSDTLYADLNRLARNEEGEVVIYIGNGHAAWEASLCNLFNRGDKVLGLINGRFGLGWVDMAASLGIDMLRLEGGSEEPVDPARIEALLREDRAHDIKAVMTVQTDTSTSIDNDIQAIRRAIDAADHPALLLVDCIATLGCQPFDMQGWGVDVMVAGCQKGLMTPPGIAFAFIGPKAWNPDVRPDLRTPYWDWVNRVTTPVFAMRFGGTPPTHHLYGLRAALDMLFDEGIDNVWRRHRMLAECVWCAVDAWQMEGGLRLQVPEPGHRSLAVTTVCSENGAATALREWCETETGVTLGVGLVATPGTNTSDDLFRIGHMGHLNPPMLLGTLASIDTGLKALGIPHREAALEHTTQLLARLIAERGLR